MTNMQAASTALRAPAPSRSFERAHGMRAFFAGISLAIATVAASNAQASPWVLQRGRIVISGGTNYQFANSEFFQETAPGQQYPGERPYSLRGEYQGVTLFTSLRAGVVDRFEFEFTLPFRSVSYTADPILLLPGAESPMCDASCAATGSRANVINFSRGALGIGDLGLALRYALIRAPSPFVMAAEVKFKAPSGYAAPEGTFGARPQSIQEFLAMAGTLARPENVRDDVTLGDGQLDITASILTGVGLRSGTFFRLDAGFNGRFGGAGQQIVGNFRAGQSIGRSLVLYGGANLQYSITKGRVIGVSVAAIDPTLPASQYGSMGPFYNLLPREVTLDRDAVDLAAGMIVRLTPTTELNFGYSRTVWGRNVSGTHSVSLTFSASTDWGSAPTRAGR